jgi:RNA polymerase sigma-70 factor (ECF subfamily)
MLGSPTEADDAVQEVWLRLSRSDTSSVDNLRGWLTTVVGRVCLDMLRARNSQREEPSDELLAVGDGAQGIDSASGSGPEREAWLSDSVGLALQVVLGTLTPAERVAFVLHDMFALPFEEIASILGRSTVATRQLASRARRRVQGPSRTSDADFTRRHQVVQAFLAAARNGDFDALLAVLDPEVVVRADGTAVKMGAAAEVRGAAAVAQTFQGRAAAAQPALVDGLVGLVWAHGGRTRVAFRFTITKEKIAAIDLVADAEQLGQMDIAVLDA